MMKRVAWTLAVVMVLGVSLSLLSGCGKKPAGETGAEPGEKKVFVILKASESEFWNIVKDGAIVAGKELGINVTVKSPVSESDISRQVAIMENAISSKPSAIVVAPSQSSPLVPAIKQAQKQGIHVIIIDSGIDSDEYTSFLASDNVKIGQIAADEMAKALVAKTGEAAGKVAGVTFFAGAASLEKRKQGFEEQLKAKYPLIEIVDFRDASGKTGQTINFVENYLTKYGTDLKGIFANNQPTGEETVSALSQAKRKDRAVIVVDSGQQEVWGLKNGFVDSMIVQKPWKMGFMGVEYALKAANGEPIEKFVDTGVAAISPAMLESGKAEEYLDPVSFHKKKSE
jgi:ribose transport system substrate-binding protein